ncbi:MAG: DUF4340 domain-containing protein [Planctomycetota bacterium]|jgi:hypothetical protein
MSDAAKTLIFVVAGIVSVAIAWVARPAGREWVAYDDSGERFFAEFDPLAATSLEIIEFDEETGAPRAFKVAQRGGVWSIPSHEDYPADAQDQLADAAGGVVDLIKGPTVSDRPGDHELYGVVDPANTGPGATGVGTRVTLQDAGGATLADFIIGKPVKDQPDLRYVRQPNHDRVYTAAVSTEKLSTDFADWIEKDLLKLDPGELREITIRGYSIDEINQRLVPSDTLGLSSDDSFEWTLEGLAEGESLATAKVNELKGALDDLEIIDVHRKPAGLSSQLRAEDALRLDSEAVRSLRSRGYYIINNQLMSNEGETIIATEKGVKYVLRFGEVAFGVRAANEASAETEPDSGGANRYLFVTADFDASLIPEPELEPLPEPADEPAAGEDAASEPADAQRQQIEQANQRKQADYGRALAEGRQKVTELNHRFADWYYVISDPVYKKIRLRRADLVEVAEGEESS